MKNWSEWPIWKKLVSFLGAFAALIAILEFFGVASVNDLWRDDGANLTPNKISTSEDPKQRTALKITFESGETCFVSFGMQFRLPEENVLEIHSYFGNSEEAEAELDTAAKASVISVLEAMKLSKVRRSRNSVEKEIAMNVSERVFSPGYVIESISLLEIDC